MKICPTAPQSAKPRMSLPTAGCARMKEKAAKSSGVLVEAGRIDEKRGRGARMGAKRR